MKNKVRIGIIGMGSMGCKYAEMILKGLAPGLELAAVTRINKNDAERLSQLLPESVPVFYDEAGLLNYEKIDAVLIATPHYAHEKHAIMALQKGLHVLCDKPMGVYTKQARNMIEEASRHNLVFSMMFNQRTNPVFVKIKEIVTSGRYGALKRVSWTITDWYRPESYYKSSAWRATWEKDGGGVLLNQCPHNLDLLQWMCGMPTKITAFCHEGKYHDIEVEDEVTAYMEFANGATGVFMASTGEGAGTNRLEIVMDNARLLCENDSLRLFVLKEDEPTYRRFSQNLYGKIEGEWENIEVLDENPKHAGILRNFAAAILEKEPLIAPGEEGMGSLMLSNAMYLSSWKGKTVELPVNEEEFVVELQKKIAQYTQRGQK